MDFQLPKLPYAKDRFDGILASRESFDFHYDKHHKAYVDQLNRLKKEAGRDRESLEDLVKNSEGALFNNAGQAYNHTFFWHCLSPETTAPSDELARKIQTDFGDVDTFNRLFIEAGKSRFGSGWAWLVKDETGKLSIVSTPNAENPIRERKIPLLVADVWEHAYYIDYRNDREGFLRKFLRCVNWDFVSKNYESRNLAAMTPLMT